MQYPPQQGPSMSQMQARAEMVVPEQPQISSAQPSAAAPEYLSPGPGQEIVLYARRGSALFRVILCLVAILLLIILVITEFLTSGPLQPGDIAPMIVTLVIVCIGSGLLAWLSWRMGFQLLFSPKPSLVITREGITVGKLLMLRSGFSLSWAEVDAMYASRLVGCKYFCIRPKNIEQFLSRFKGFERVGKHSSWRISAPVMIPQGYLEKPIEEILQDISALYGNELSYYHVRLHS